MGDLVTTVLYVMALILAIPAIVFLFKLLLHVGFLVGLMGIFTGNIILGLAIIFICALLMSIFNNDVGDIAPNYSVFDSDGNHLFDIFKNK